MTDEDYHIALKYNYAMKAKRELLNFKDMLSDEDIIDIINQLVTFQNSHLIANNFKDDQVTYALKEELNQKYKKDTKWE